MLALFIEQPTPFLPEFMERIASLTYPRSKIDLFVHTAVEFHDKDITEFLEATNNENSVQKWNSVTHLKADERVAERTARNLGVQR